MAVYKVAQDVEADDKLLGPFSFRQFIYLIIVAISIGLAWGLAQLFVGLAIIPLPLIIFFGALALPLRKDQPMEVYLAALVSFYLKPHRRIWVPDGIESLIEITVPRTIEVQRTKDITETEAERRLSYLADIADTEGWAIRHAVEPITGSAMTTDAFFDAQHTEDILDAQGGVSQSLDAMMNQANERRRQDMVARMQAAAQPTVVATQAPIAPAPTPSTTAPSLLTPAPSPLIDPALTAASTVVPSQVVQPVVTPVTQPAPAAVATPLYNPYPTEIHQRVIQPLEVENQLTPAMPQINQPTTAVTQPVSPPANNPTTSTSETTVSPDIISLANNSDLSIETIQREANRIQHKSDEADGDEVFISLH